MVEQARGAEPAWPPGALNPAVTQATIHRTICKDGWTTTVRPPDSYTNKLKREQMAERGLPGKPGDYEEDHFIPLELGGAPRDPANLWPQPYASEWGARKKDRLETTLHRKVCAGEVSLDAAREAVRKDWTKAYGEYVK
jgi:hypothetical protein